MTVREWIASTLLGVDIEQARASAPIPFHAATQFIGMGQQPTHATLLKEAKGWAAIATRAIADRISSLQIEIVRRVRVADGTVSDQVIDDHPLGDLLDNGWINHSATAAKSLIAHHIVTVGEAYLLKIQDRGGMPRELAIMQPANVTPLASGGMVVGYKVLTGSGDERVLQPEEVVRAWRPDPEGSLLTAEGILGPQAAQADAATFIGEHIRSHFERDATPPTVITGTSGAVPPDESELRRFQEMWMRAYNQRTGKFRGLPAFIPSGFDIKELAVQRGADLRPILDHLRDQILMAYGVPRSIVGDVVDANRAAAETNQYVFDRNTIMPITSLIEGAINRQLVPDFGDDLRVRFRPFVADDKDFDLRREEQRLRLKVLSINEIRTDEGLDRADWGDLPVGTVAEVPYDASAGLLMDDEAEALDLDIPPERIRAYRIKKTTKAIEQEWQRVLNRERKFVRSFRGRVIDVLERQRKAIMAALEAQAASRTRIELGDLQTTEIIALIREVLRTPSLIELFDKRMETVRRQAVMASGEEAIVAAATAAGILPKTFEFTPVVRSILANQAQSFRERVNSTTLKQLANDITRTLAESVIGGETVDDRTRRIRGAVRKRMDIRKGHARTIARTEVLKATQEAQLEGFRQSGVVKLKRWNTSRDNAVRHSHRIDGQIRPLEHNFTLSSSVSLAAPGQSGIAEEDINCRCFVTPVVD